MLPRIVAVLLSPFLLSLSVTVLLPWCFRTRDTFRLPVVFVLPSFSPCCLKPVPVLLYLLLFYAPCCSSLWVRLGREVLLVLHVFAWFPSCCRSYHLVLFFFLGAGCSTILLAPCVSILVSSPVPAVLSPYFSIPFAILLSRCFRSKESPCLPFLTALSIAQCSSFWWL